MNPLERLLNDILRSREVTEPVGTISDDLRQKLVANSEAFEALETELHEKMKAAAEAIKAEFDPKLEATQEASRALWEDVYKQCGIPEEKQNDFYRYHPKTGEVVRVIEDSDELEPATDELQ